MSIEKFYVILAVKGDGTEVVAAFTDREVAVSYFKKLLDKNVEVSLHSVEFDTAKDLIQEFDL